MTEPKTFGQRLRLAMSQMDMTPLQLSKRLGQKQVVQISKWVNDRLVPGTRRLKDLAAILGVSADWLLNGDNPPAWLGHGAKSAPVIKTAKPGRNSADATVDAVQAMVLVYMTREVQGANARELAELREMIESGVLRILRRERGVEIAARLTTDFLLRRDDPSTRNASRQPKRALDEH